MSAFYKVPHPALQQAGYKGVGISVPIIPSKLLQLADRQLASPSSLEGMIGTEISALFWPACHYAGCGLSTTYLDF